MRSVELYTPPGGGGVTTASANSSAGLQFGLAIPVLSAAAILAALMYLLAASRRGRR